MKGLLDNEEFRFEILKRFPKLQREGFTVTSPEEIDYNCIAFAAGDITRCWWPDSMNSYYWDPTVPREATLESFKQIFINLGYQVCESSQHEIGFEKVAIFVNRTGEPTHCARQNIRGIWLSKLGGWYDIEHTSVDGVSGPSPSYGKAVAFLKRGVPTAEV
jgi:hypothetical protein